MAFSVFAGGDDRDQAYYENLDEELAAFEAQLAEDLANQKGLEAFQQKLADEKAAAAKSNAAYQSKLANDAKVAALMEELAIEQALKVFEAKLKAELAAQEMMAEIEAEMARQAALEAFQQKLADEKAAAAASNAAYQDRLLEEEFAALEAELASEAIEREIFEFEANLAKELADQAAKEMMAEIAQEAVEREIAEFETELALEAFQQKLADEKAAAAVSTAAYQAKLAYDARIDKILQDLVVKLEEVIMPDDYKSVLVEELIEEATAKLEEEEFIGAISGEIVTVAIHEFCKENLNLSDSNIELFKKALAGGYLGNVGPQIDAGTEFTANRWDKYITCVGSKGN